MTNFSDSNALDTWVLDTLLMTPETYFYLYRACWIFPYMEYFYISCYMGFWLGVSSSLGYLAYIHTWWVLFAPLGFAFVQDYARYPWKMMVMGLYFDDIELGYAWALT